MNIDEMSALSQAAGKMLSENCTPKQIAFMVIIGERDENQTTIYLSTNLGLKEQQLDVLNRAMVTVNDPDYKVNVEIV